MNILIVIVAMLGVVCIALAILNIVVRKRNRALAKDLSVSRNQNNNLLLENVQLQDRIDTDITNLHAQNADLREALQEAHATIKSLHMNTVEVQEVAPERKPQRRNRAGKAGTQ